MRLLEQDQLKEMPELEESWIAQDGPVSPHEPTLKKVGERVPNSEISPPEVRTLVAQCSFLVVIAGVVAWLIAA
jgi:hypothetical protein